MSWTAGSAGTATAGSMATAPASSRHFRIRIASERPGETREITEHVILRGERARGHVALQALVIGRDREAHALRHIVVSPQAGFPAEAAARAVRGQAEAGFVVVHAPVVVVEPRA